MRIGLLKFITMNSLSAQLFHSLLIGTALAFLICPYLMLHPTDINYLRLDEGQHFFGWAFYRADGWHWPITVTYDLMYPLGVSIVFTDSFPLLTVLLKSVSHFLPANFVFHGIVLVLNLSLMFFSANLLLRKLTADRTYSFFASFFFVLATPFIFRFSASHAALASHWLIVLSLVPLVTPSAQPEKTLKLFWVLFLLSFGIHAYLSSMVMIFLLTYVCQLLCQKVIPILRIVKLSFFGVVTMLLTMYVLGYFFNYGTGQSTGFGYYCANLQAFFNPVLNTSLFFPSIEQPDGQLGGYAYLGLGVFLMVPVAIIYLFRFKPWKNELIPLYIALLLCWLFSLSNNIYWGKLLIFHYDVDFSLFHIFRASNRYLWLPFYAILLFLIIGLFKCISRPRARLIVLLCLLVLQVADIFPLIIKLRTAFLPKPYAYGHELDKSFWLKLGEKYRHMYIDLRYIDQFNTDYYGNAHMYKLAFFAVQNHMTLNNFYLARTTAANEQYNQKTYIEFLEGKMAPDTLYVMDDKTMAHLHADMKASSCRKEGVYNVCSLKIEEEKKGK